jgi:hypothetical protein
MKEYRNYTPDVEIRATGQQKSLMHKKAAPPIGGAPDKR